MGKAMFDNSHKSAVVAERRTTTTRQKNRPWTSLWYNLTELIGTYPKDLVEVIV